MLTIEDIEANKTSIKQVLLEVPDLRQRPKDAIMTDNAEWLTTSAGSRCCATSAAHFSVNRMLSMDSVKLRLDRDNEHGLSFIEFNYMILQAYDFTVLARRHGCNLHMGGSDQWGNIVNGFDLGRGSACTSSCADDAAADDLLRREDGQDGRRRGLAQRRHALALRLLAVVLAERRGRRRREIPEALHAAAIDGIARLSRSAALR